MTGTLDLTDKVDYQGSALRELAETVEALTLDVANLNISVEALAVAASNPAAPSSGGPAEVEVEPRYASAQEWVAAEFAVLAAPLLAAGGRWCLHWQEHPAVYRRVSVMWETWEVMHRPGSTAAMREEWLRLIFDHHAPPIFSQSGPLAACSAVNQRHTPPQRLPLLPAGDGDPVAPGVPQP